MAITHIVLHYSATYEDQDIGAAEIDQMHRARGWSGIGYHYVIRLDGTVEIGRSPETRTGAHVGGANTGKIGICCIGGLRRSSGPNVGVDTRTNAQKSAFVRLIQDIHTRHPDALVRGHRDFTATQCPAYDAAAWWASVDRVAFENVSPANQSLPTVSFPMLQTGSKSSSVKKVQRILREKGHLEGAIDGKFGPVTKRAVEAFQASAGVDVDGIVGPMTWAELLKEQPEAPLAPAVEESTTPGILARLWAWLTGGK